MPTKKKLAPVPSKTNYAEVKTQRFAIADLKEAPYNARTITDVALQGLTHSLEQFGVLALPVVNLRKDGPRLIGGHQRVKALLQRGESEVDCVVVTFDDEREKRANFALNNSAIEGTFVPELTRELLERLTLLLGPEAPDLISGLRFDTMLKQVMRQMEATAGVDDVVDGGKTEDDEDVAGLAKSKPNSKAGLFYQLGPHRLFCGKLLEVGTLKGFGVERADMGFSRVSAHEGFADGFLDVYLGHMLKNTDGGVYIATSMARLAEVHRSFVQIGGHWSNTILAWPSAQGRANEPYRDVTIPILYGWRADGMKLFFGDRTQSNTVTLKKSPPKDDLPVELIVRHLLNSSRKDGVVLDVAVGRGSTLIAAQKTGRKLIGYVSGPREMDRVRLRWSRFVHGVGSDWKALTTGVGA